MPPGDRGFVFSGELPREPGMEPGPLIPGAMESERERVCMRGDMCGMLSACGCSVPMVVIDAFPQVGKVLCNR